MSTDNFSKLVSRIRVYSAVNGAKSDHTRDKSYPPVKRKYAAERTNLSLDEAPRYFTADVRSMCGRPIRFQTRAYFIATMSWILEYDVLDVVVDNCINFYF